LKSYSDDQIKAILRTGTRPDGSHVLPPMPSPYFYAKISDDDVSAIVAYLRALPAKD
jgi:cytochrome c553